MLLPKIKAHTRLDMADRTTHDNETIPFSFSFFGNFFQPREVATNNKGIEITNGRNNNKVSNHIN